MEEDRVDLVLRKVTEFQKDPSTVNGHALLNFLRSSEACGVHRDYSHLRDRLEKNVETDVRTRIRQEVEQEQQELIDFARQVINLIPNFALYEKM